MTSTLTRKTKDVETAFGKIRYQYHSGSEGETAVPIVAVHGWLDNARTFAELLPLLNVPAYALDLPGHGGSDWLTDYPFIQWLPVLRSFLDALNIEKCHLVGHSLGGSIGLMYAGFDDRIASVVSIDAMGPWAESGEDWRASFWKAASERLKQRPAARARKFKILCEARKFALGYLTDEMASELVLGGAKEVDDGWMFTHDPRLKNKSLLRCTESHVQASFKTIRCPVLTIRAESGYPVPEGSIERRLKPIRKLTYISVSGHHHVHLSEAGKIADLITTFWADNRADIDSHSKEGNEGLSHG